MNGRNRSVKFVALVLVLALLMGSAIGGTLAWLIAQSNTVTNTFTVGDIEISLSESIPEAQRNSIKMVPGARIAKDPVVTVAGGSEACWLFVEVTAENTEEFIVFTVDTGTDGWTRIGSTNVYGRAVAASASNQPFNVLVGTGVENDPCKDGYVTVLDTVTKEMMEEISADANKAPKLTFTAYAIQSENLKKDGAAVTTVENAWAVYQNPPQAPAPGTP